MTKNNIKWYSRGLWFIVHPTWGNDITGKTTRKKDLVKGRW